MRRANTDEYWRRRREQKRKEREAMGIDLDKYTESKWIKASDIGDSTFPVVIDRVTEEKIYDRDSNSDRLVPAIWFRGAHKALIPAKMNLQDLAAELGDDTDRWAGRRGELYTERTSFGPGARLRITDGEPRQPKIDTVQKPPWEREPAVTDEFTNENLTPTDDLPF